MNDLAQDKLKELSMRIDNTKRYYVIHTEKGREQTIDVNLTAKGYEIYCPLVLVDRRILARWRNKYVEPLFPCYLFLHMDEDGDWPGLKIFGEIIQILKGPEGYPEPIDDKIIELLKSHENENGVHEIGDWRYRAGDRVRLKKGAFAGYEAIISEVPEKRLTVVFKIMQREIKIPVTDRDIEPV